MIGEGERGLLNFFPWKKGGLIRDIRGAGGGGGANWRIYGKYILPRNKLIWVDSKILVKNGIAISPRWLLQKVKWTVHATAISDHFFCYCSVLTNNLNQSAQITSWVIHMKKDHPLRHVQDGVKLAQKYRIHYFPTPIKHLVYPPSPLPLKKALHKHCFQFLLGFTILPRKLENNTYAKFWGVNKVYYG